MYSLKDFRGVAAHTWVSSDGRAKIWEQRGLYDVSVGGNSSHTGFDYSCNLETAVEVINRLDAGTWMYGRGTYLNAVTQDVQPLDWLERMADLVTAEELADHSFRRDRESRKYFYRVGYKIDGRLYMFSDRNGGRGPFADQFLSPIRIWDFLRTRSYVMDKIGLTGGSFFIDGPDEVAPLCKHEYDEMMQTPDSEQCRRILPFVQVKLQAHDEGFNFEGLIGRTGMITIDGKPCYTKPETGDKVFVQADGSETVYLLDTETLFNRARVQKREDLSL